MLRIGQAMSGSPRLLRATHVLFAVCALGSRRKNLREISTGQSIRSQSGRLFGSSSRFISIA
jgi:hypothetical protein